MYFRVVTIPILYGECNVDVARTVDYFFIHSHLISDSKLLSPKTVKWKGII